MTDKSSEEVSDKPEPLIIKKYANRRLYNTATAEFVTLSDLHVLVKEGVEFVVRDAKSGADLTGSILAQIVADEENKGNNVFSTDYLRQILKLYGDGIGTDLTSFLEQSIDTFAKNQQQAVEQMQNMFGGGETMEQLAEISRNNIEMFQKSMGMFGGAGNSNPSDAKESRQEDDKSSDDEAEIAKLKRELAEMQQRLDSLSRDS